jgi:hypothetical protein
MKLINPIIYDRRKVFGALDKIFTGFQDPAEEGSE